MKITEGKITYRLEGDYYIPLIALKEEDQRPIFPY